MSRFSDSPLSSLACDSVSAGAVLKGAPLWQKWAILLATYVQTLVFGGKIVDGGRPRQIDSLVLTELFHSSQ